MIKLETKKEKLRLYECPECHLHYKERAWMEKCEEWCKKTNSCNLKITSHAEENKKGRDFFKYPPQDYGN